MQYTVKQDIVYQGFGFPVLLKGVEFRGTGIDRYTDIRHKEIAKRLVMMLIHLPHAWTVAELRFIRKECDLTQHEFAALAYLSPDRVESWERRNHDDVGFMGNDEKGIRNRIARKWLDLEARIALSYELGPLDLSIARPSMLSIEV